MKIVLSAIWYPVAIARYFEAALRRRKDVELFVVGPYTGRQIPWGGGMQLPEKYAKAPDLALPPNMSVSINYIEDQLTSPLPWKPDLWIQIDAGFHFIGKPGDGKNVIIATDPHVLNYDQQRNFADDFYCMQTPYMKDGDKYLPYAYDPIWHSKEEQPQNYDVALIGLHYPNRSRLVEALIANGLNVYYDLGPSFDEARALYNQAPIGLNWSSLQDLTARVFELLGMQRLAVVNDVPDLHGFFEHGRDLIVFNNLEDAVAQVMYYAKNPLEAQAIATEGQKTVQPHTWDERIKQVINDI